MLDDDEIAAVVRARLGELDRTVPPVVSLEGDADEVLAHLDGHPDLRVLPGEGWPVLRSRAIERMGRDRGAPDAQARLAGWLDEQGPARHRARWIVGSGLAGARRTISLNGIDPSGIVARLGLEPHPTLDIPTYNRRQRREAVVASHGGEDDHDVVSELRAIARRRIGDATRIEQPLVLISQIQRSGGHLVNQLLDGHPEVHTHPHELHIGHPEAKLAWPRLDPTPGVLHSLDRLYEINPEWLQAGYGAKRMRALERGTGRREDLLPFLIVPSLARQIFLDQVAARTASTARDLIDAWFTAYFNAWLDNSNLTGQKRWVSAFAAMLMTRPGQRERFFADYPDGRLIGVVREPSSWWASARLHGKRHRARDSAIAAWSSSTRALIETAAAEPKRALLLDFDSVVRDPTGAGRLLARWLGIQEHRSLAEPSFNGFPIPANSSFAVDRPGVIASPLGRSAEVDAVDRAWIRRSAGGLHSAAIEIARRYESLPRPPDNPPERALDAL